MQLKKAWFVAVALALSSLAMAGQVNINTADVQTLETVKGLGPKKAEAIVEYRKQHGPFKSVEDLTQVPGIKDLTLEKVRSQLTVGESATESTPEPAGAPTQPEPGAAK
jgi:competence protein ComEA